MSRRRGEIKFEIEEEDFSNVLMDDDIQRIFDDEKIISDCKKFDEIDIPSCKKRLEGSQGSFYLDCFSPRAKGKSIKSNSVNQYLSMYGTSKTDAPIHLKPFTNMCRMHEKIQRLSAEFPNLVTIYDCWYCFEKGNLHRALVFVMQEYLRNGISFDKYLKDGNGKILHRTITSVIIQVIGTLEKLKQHGLYHNDLHVGNIFLVPWLDDTKIHYHIGDKDFYLDKDNSPWLVKIIDYGLMTDSYSLDAKYLPLSDLSPKTPDPKGMPLAKNIQMSSGGIPWIDICQFLAGLQEIPHRDEFNGLFSFCQKTIHSTARELVKPLKYDYDLFVNILYALYKKYLVPPM